MSVLRTHLHQWLTITGVALTLIFIVIAGLSYQNPLAVMGFLAIGIAAGGVVSAVGLLLEHAATIAASQKAMQASLHAVAQASIRQMQATEAVRDAIRAMPTQPPGR